MGSGDSPVGLGAGERGFIFLITCMNLAIGIEFTDKRVVTICSLGDRND